MAADVYPRSHGSLSGLSDTDHHIQYALVISGLLAARPVSGWRLGRMYRATDTAQVFFDNGAGWDEFAKGADLTAQAQTDADQSVLYWMGMV